MIVDDLKQLLTFDNDEPFETAQFIIDECEKKDIDLFISRTGENEILLYVIDDGDFHNIIIDEDNDLYYMFIGHIRKRSTVSEIKKPYDIQEIVSKYLTYGI